MTHLIVEALAAIYLITTASIMQVKNMQSAVIFKAIPGALGWMLAFFVYAQWMGWPV